MFYLLARNGIWQAQLHVHLHMDEQQGEGVCLRAAYDIMGEIWGETEQLIALNEGKRAWEPDGVSLSA